MDGIQTGYSEGELPAGANADGEDLEELPPEVRATRNRIGCLLTLVGIGFVIALVLAADSGNWIRMQLASRRSLPDDYVARRDSIDGQLPENLIRIWVAEETSAAEENAAPIQQWQQLVESIASESERRQNVAIESPLVSLNRLLLEIEACGVTDRVNSANRSYWQEWLEGRTLASFALRGQVALVGWSWLERDATACLAVVESEPLQEVLEAAGAGDDEQAVYRSSMLYVIREDEQWRVYDQRRLEWPASRAHVLAAQTHLEKRTLEDWETSLLSAESLMKSKLAEDILAARVQVLYEQGSDVDQGSNVDQGSDVDLEQLWTQYALLQMWFQRGRAASLVGAQRPTLDLPQPTEKSPLSLILVVFNSLDEHQAHALGEHLVETIGWHPDLSELVSIRKWNQQSDLVRALTTRSIALGHWPNSVLDAFAKHADDQSWAVLRQVFSRWDDSKRSAFEHVIAKTPAESLGKFREQVTSRQSVVVGTP